MKIFKENKEGRIFKILEDTTVELKSKNFKYSLTEGLYLLKNVITSGKLINGYFFVDSYGSVFSINKKYINKGVENV